MYIWHIDPSDLRRMFGNGSQRILFMVPAVLAWTLLFAQRDSLRWDPARPITFADYTGRRPPVAVGYAAATTCALYVMPYKTVEGGVGWDVLAYFSSTRSWVDPFHVEDSLLLRHERLHFDLVEIHARELRHYLAEYQVRSTPQEVARLKELFAQRRAQSDAEQLVYDSETRHGGDRATQRRWEADVVARLKALEKYR